MWPFRRKPTVTNAAYARWLRAWQPPWLWFLGLTDAQQETVAQLGDARSQDMILAVGYALHDPELADAGASGDEEALAIRLARNLAARVQAGQGAPA